MFSKICNKNAVLRYFLAILFRYIKKKNEEIFIVVVDSSAIKKPVEK